MCPLPLLANQCTWKSAVSNAGASDKNEWKSGMASTSVTVDSAALSRGDPGSAAAEAVVPSSTPFTECDGYFAACKRIFNKAFVSKVYTHVITATRIPALLELSQ